MGGWGGFSGATTNMGGGCSAGAEAKKGNGSGKGVAGGVTGGSDFHGEVKPSISLGTGKCNNLDVPDELLEKLKGLSARV